MHTHKDGKGLGWDGATSFGTPNTFEDGVSDGEEKGWRWKKNKTS